MKENSIEKTIEQLEVILKARKIHKECVGESCTNCNPDIEALTNTIEFLLDYKRVLKENEELKNDYENLNNSVVVKNYYIKNKIEEIQEEGYWLFTTDRDSNKCVEVLQQLLGKE